MQRLSAFHSCFLYYRQFRKFIQRLFLLGIIETGDSLVAAENNVLSEMISLARGADVTHQMEIYILPYLRDSGNILRFLSQDAIGCISICPMIRAKGCL